MVETTVIIDIIVAAVLLAFVILGARRGLFRSVAGLAILVVSLVGANMAADSLTPMAAGIMQPAIENRVEEKLGEVLPEDMELPEAEDTAMGELLALLGIDADPAEEILERAGEQVRRNGAGAVAAVAVGVAESTIHVAVFLLVFLAAFVVLKLPVLSGANALGGAAVGLVEGVLALFITVWFLRRFGVSFDTAWAADTMLLRFFTTNTPLGVLALT